MIQSCKKLIIIFSIFMLASCGGGGTGSSVSSNVTKILAIGDSIGAGFGGTNPWPRLVQEKTGVTVINNSASGRQASGSLSLVNSEIATHQPSHLIILLGTNDANNGSPSSAIDHMRRIVAAAQAAGVIPVVGTLPPIPSSSSASSRARSISSGYRALGVPIAEVEGAFGDNTALFQADLFHPNNEGQNVIANAFVNAL